MKLIRHGAPGAEKPGLMVDGGIRVEASAFGEDYDEHFFATDGLERLKTWLAKEITLPPLPDDVRLGPPTCRPSKLRWKQKSAILPLEVRTPRGAPSIPFMTIIVKKWLKTALPPRCHTPHG